MKSPKETPPDIGTIEILDQEKKALRDLIDERLKILDPKSSMSLGGFFNTIQISILPISPYRTEFITKWNAWIIEQKKKCIQPMRGNSVSIPKINYEETEEFFQTLEKLGLIDTRTLPLKERYQSRIGSLV